MSTPRRWALSAIVAGVLMAHLLLTQGIASRMHDMSSPDAASIKRMDAEFVADMKLTAPPVIAASPVAAAQVEPEAAELATQAASKPVAEIKPKLKYEQKTKPSAPEENQEAARSRPASPQAEALAAAEAASKASTAATALAAPVLVPPVLAGIEYRPKDSAESSAPPATAASGPAFEWPKATRVTYKSHGFYRGEIHGNAKVQWIKNGDKYQAQFDITLGPSFAPIGSQRLTSEGVITPDGLRPEKYESVNRLVIATSKPSVVVFNETEIELPNGDKVPKLPGVQDPASHYIQLAYQFIQHPEQLAVGKTIEVPMVLARKQRVVYYEVLLKEDLDTPLGKIPAFKLRPRPNSNSQTEILAEIWLAPSLQYLPIRLLLRQGEETYLDSVMDKAPQQIAAEPDR